MSHQCCHIIDWSTGWVSKTSYLHTQISGVLFRVSIGGLTSFYSWIAVCAIFYSYEIWCYGIGFSIPSNANSMSGVHNLGNGKHFYNSIACLCLNAGCECQQIVQSDVTFSIFIDRIYSRILRIFRSYFFSCSCSLYCFILL